MYSVGELVVIKKNSICPVTKTERSYGIVLYKIEWHYLDTYSILCEDKIVSIIDHFIEKI